MASERNRGGEPAGRRSRWLLALSAALALAASCIILLLVSLRDPQEVKARSLIRRLHAQDPFVVEATLNGPVWLELPPGPARQKVEGRVLEILSSQNKRLVSSAIMACQIGRLDLVNDPAARGLLATAIERYNKYAESFRGASRTTYEIIELDDGRHMISVTKIVPGGSKARVIPVTGYTLLTA